MELCGAASSGVRRDEGTARSSAASADGRASLERVPRARGGNQPIENFEQELGLPAGFCARPYDPGPALGASLDFLQNQRPPGQNYWPALVLALIGQAEKVLVGLGATSVDNVFGDLQREEVSARGRVLNTLNFVTPDGSTFRLRPSYTKVLSVIRSEMRRFAHPSNPQGATNSWQHYQPLIESIYRATPDQRAALARWVWDNGVLPITETVPGGAAGPRRERPFSYVLEHMPTSSNPGGAIFQAEAYAYLRADAPNVILESHAVNVGSRRAGLVGDVDGFRGDAVELAAEVKDLVIDEDNLEDQLGDFLVAVAEIPDATAIVFAAGFSDEAREALAAQNVVALDRGEMATIAAVWDFPKQAEAMGALIYFLARIQNRPQLVEQVRSYCQEHGLELT